MYKKTTTRKDLMVLTYVDSLTSHIFTFYPKIIEHFEPHQQPP
jgi:hypothetical protein